MGKERFFPKIGEKINRFGIKIQGLSYEIIGNSA